MDDHNFDKESAIVWSEAIESIKSGRRDDYLYPRISSWMDCFAIKKVLDIGCGQGVCATKIDLVDRSYTGVEPSSYLLKRAKNLYPEFRDAYVMGNAYDLPMSDETFDGAFSIAVWHLLKDLSKACLELSRVLRKNGRFFILTANHESIDEWTRSYDDFKQEGSKVVGVTMLEGQKETIDTLFIRSLEEIEIMTTNANLVITSNETIGVWRLLEGFKQ